MPNFIFVKRKPFFLYFSELSYSFGDDREHCFLQRLPDKRFDIVLVIFHAASGNFQFSVVAFYHQQSAVLENNAAYSYTVYFFKTFIVIFSSSTSSFFI